MYITCPYCGGLIQLISDINQNSDFVLDTIIDYPAKGTEIYVTMKSGAVYRGIFQRYRSDGGGNIELQDVKICQRGNPGNWIICPKRGMNRKLWVSKIDHISIQQLK